MEHDIRGKRIVITGGADGIGYAIAKTYLQAGAEVVVIADIDDKTGARAVQELNETFGNGKAVYIECDVTLDLERVYSTVIKTYTRIDVLVNSAGTADDSVPRRMIDICATSVLEWSLKFYEHMRKDRGGYGGIILNISSIFGYKVVPFATIYQTAKFAVQGFTRSLGHVDNYHKTFVRVVALCPGFTETKLNLELKEAINETNNHGKLFPVSLIEYVKAHGWQNTEVVGDAALKVFRKAKSGSSWLIEAGEPVVEIHHY